MSSTDIIILLSAGAAIALVNWYFLFGRKTVRAAPAAGGVQDVTVRVEGGYDPSIIEVAAGRPVRLTFDRRETNPCSEELVIGSLGIRRDLPAFQKTTIEFTPPAPGKYDFTCGMGMLHGAIVAR